MRQGTEKLDRPSRLCTALWVVYETNTGLAQPAWRMAAKEWNRLGRVYAHPNIAPWIDMKSKMNTLTEFSAYKYNRAGWQ